MLLLTIEKNMFYDNNDEINPCHILTEVFLASALVIFGTCSQVTTCLTNIPQTMDPDRSSFNRNTNITTPCSNYHQLKVGTLL